MFVVGEGNVRIGVIEVALVETNKATHVVATFHARYGERRMDGTTFEITHQAAHVTISGLVDQDTCSLNIAKSTAIHGTDEGSHVIGRSLKVNIGDDISNGSTVSNTKHTHLCLNKRAMHSLHIVTIAVECSSKWMIFGTHRDPNVGIHIDVVGNNDVIEFIVLMSNNDSILTIGQGDYPSQLFRCGDVLQLSFCHIRRITLSLRTFKVGVPSLEGHPGLKPVEEVLVEILFKFVLTQVMHDEVLRLCIRNVKIRFRIIILV